MKIKDFTPQNKCITNLLLTSFTSGVATNGSNYLSLSLQDNTGEIQGKYWSVPQDKMHLKLGVVYQVSFDIINYKNTLQLRVNSIDDLDQSNIDYSDFLKTAPLNKEELKERIKQYLNIIDNDKLYSITTSLLKEYEDKFYTYPAAVKIHHNYRGGLAYHTLCMLNLANKICTLYPIISKNLLFSAIIIHDLGKVEELKFTNVGEYSIAGNLIGHISIINSKINEIAKDLRISDSEEVMLLSHLVLSHHGKHEFGSPILPQIIEAEVLHFIDNFDAKMEIIKEYMLNVKDNEFGTRLFSLDNRSFYKHNIK